MTTVDRAYLTKRVWAAWRGKGLSEEDLYLLVSFRFGKSRLRELDDAQLAELAKVVSDFVQPVVLRDASKSLRMTDPQFAKLKRQLSDLKWTAKRFAAWVYDYRMVPHWDGAVESIWPDEARNIIAALERMRATSKMKKYRARSDGGAR